ncbi:thioesterase family protein [Pseudohongiella sp. SYSU M77423]|uniref:acyl-CoA thioesterase n=1 Tax=unclassified Pseudohongiella TaxID=2629611 RepID=UPI001F2F3C22|nr:MULTISPECIES: thioesterase family protein [unclassified Pseudohongiella]MDH7944033.1 thioesterase family protein [Pseudohongiella sp. SYSU M77423]
MHPLDEAIAMQPVAPGMFAASTHPGYANAVGPFGGITAAQLLNAALLHEERLGEPVSQTVHFAAPIADGAFRIEARPVRTNRSTQHWLINAIQDDKLVAMATAVFAIRRPTWSGTDAKFPDAPAPESVAAMNWDKRPEFTHRYDLRYSDDSLPKTFTEPERENGASQLWVRDVPERPLDFPALASICDVFFPRVMIRRQRWSPIGTVTLTSYFHADSQTLGRVGSRHLLGVARAQAYRDGFFDQSAEVWSPEGELLATSHQMVYFKD